MTTTGDARQGPVRAGNGRGEVGLSRRASAKVAMIGAGQLARMTHQAAVDLDIDLVVLAESTNDSAVVGGAPYRLGSGLPPAGRTPIYAASWCCNDSSYSLGDM